MVYRILYSETSRNQIKRLHPQIKAAVKSKIKRLKEDSFAGNWLEKKLSGYACGKSGILCVKEQHDDCQRHH